MEDTSNGPGPGHIQEPFTKAELIQQLADLDSDISLLLSHTGTAIQSLAQPVNATSSAEQDPGYGTLEPDTNPEDTIANLDAEERLATFKTSMSAFMTTLHSVDVRLKRQIWGLEEAGIITLKGSRQQAAAEAGSGAPGGSGSGADAVTKTTLEPDGVGKVGGLDVGWLNARSNKIERDMESELWTGMRKHLEDIAEGRMQVGNELFGSARTSDPAVGEEPKDMQMEG